MIFLIFTLEQKKAEVMGLAFFNLIFLNYFVQSEGRWLLIFIQRVPEVKQEFKVRIQITVSFIAKVFIGGTKCLMKWKGKIRTR